MLAACRASIRSLRSWKVPIAGSQRKKLSTWYWWYGVQRLSVTDWSFCWTPLIQTAVTPMPWR